MANVMFKRGTQSGFNNLTAYQDGCFYLTTDSHRLYVGTGNNTADLVSQSVISYRNWAAIEALSNKSSSSYAPGLCTEGQFYYA
nr:MAG TPA: major tropism determinant [Caudoviricetes sp.]